MLKKIKRTIDTALNVPARRLRDALIHRYPLTHMLLPTRQEDAWIKVFVDALRESSFFSIGDILKKTDLGITQAATGLTSDVDLSAAACPFIFDAMNRLSETTGEKLYLLVEGEWKAMCAARFKAWITRPSDSGGVELAIVDREYRLTERFSINLWRQSGKVLECTTKTAPVKKTFTGKPDRARVKLDSFIEPIDVVYTWVNADDPEWQELIAPYRKEIKVDHDRFSQLDELRYSLRSLCAFAPWVRNIFILTNCTAPSWFQPTESIRWIRHEEIIPSQYLPLFNSHAIETFLHQIPGLSERFIYFNDDVFLSGPVGPTDFFNAYGQSTSRMEPSGVLTHLEERVTSGIAEEWQHAAVNGSRLIFKESGVYPTRLHRHTPHAYLRSVCSALAQRFPTELETTRKARFRNRTDYSFASFLYHHYAIWQGKAQIIDEEAMIVRPTNYKHFLSNRMYVKQRFFCINDGGGSGNDESFRRFKENFLKGRYSFKSPAEI